MMHCPINIRFSLTTSGGWLFSYSEIHVSAGWQTARWFFDNARDGSMIRKGQCYYCRRIIISMSDKSLAILCVSKLRLFT